MKKPLKMPRFKSAGAERAFWSRLDLTRHFGPGDFERVSLPNLKPTSRPISIRVPEYLLNRIKEQANEIHIPYQALIKEYLKAGAFGQRRPAR